MFNLTILYKSMNLNIYYTEDYNNIDFLQSLDNDCYIFFQFTWNIEPKINDFPWDYLKSFPKSFNVNKNIIWCSPNESCKDIITGKGYTSILANHNCLLDYNLFNIQDYTRIYDTVINSRPFWWKRVYLANKINNLVYIKGNDWAKNESSWDGYINMNLTLKTEITPNEVKNIYNQSKIGLILSGNTGSNQQGLNEGANYSTGEYLLSGLPVVTTPSQGGRSEWLDDYNSLVCEPQEDKILDCVNIMLKRLENNEIDRNKIRNDMIQKMLLHRRNIINQIQLIIDIHNINIDANNLFDKIYFNKLCTYNNIKW